MARKPREERRARASNPWAAAARRAELAELERIAKAEAEARERVRIAAPASDGEDDDASIFAELVDRDASARAASPGGAGAPRTAETPAIPAPDRILPALDTPTAVTPVVEQSWLSEPVNSPVDPDEAVAEGLLLAETTVVMGLKNRMIVQALGARDAFVEHDHLADARLELITAADELERSADLAQQEYVTALQRPGKAATPHGYRRRDAGNLRLREQVALRTADILRGLGDEVNYVSSLVDRARRDAWNEVGEAILARLQRRLDGVDSFDGTVPPEDAETAAERAERIDGVHGDLAALAEQRARERDPSAEESAAAVARIAEAQDPYGAF